VLGRFLSLGHEDVGAEHSLLGVLSSAKSAGPRRLDMPTAPALDALEAERLLGLRGQFVETKLNI
jgi:hypothetical protein